MMNAIKNFSAHRAAVVGKFATIAISLIIACSALTIHAQTVIGGNTPDPSAMLDIQSTSKGVLFPRVPNRGNVTSPATGLMIFNTGSGCLEINLGTPAQPQWESVKCIECGAYVASGVWKRFMCYNLGAANTTENFFTPSWEINGGYWQWGRMTQAAPGPTGVDGSVPNDGTPNTWTPAGAAWNTSNASNGSWADASTTTTPTAKGTEDPCPAGFRVPSKAQWEGVIDNTLNPQSNAVGSSWSPGAANYSAGKNFGPALFLPAAGLRDDGSGTLFSRGSYGGYWSSTEDGAVSAWSLGFFSGGASVSSGSRAYGLSVRCVAE